MTKIHSLQNDNKEQYVHNRPFEGIRNDYGDKELQGLAVDKRDYETLETIKIRIRLKPTTQRKDTGNKILVFRIKKQKTKDAC